MTASQRLVYHRKLERQHVSAARYFIRNKDYVEAARRLTWAIQQETAADCAASEVTAEKKRASDTKGSGR